MFERENFTVISCHQLSQVGGESESKCESKWAYVGHSRRHLWGRRSIRVGQLQLRRAKVVGSIIPCVEMWESIGLGAWNCDFI
jgi:hypothetical protein